MWWDEETEFYISLIKLGLKMIEGCYSCCLLKGNIHRQLKVYLASKASTLKRDGTRLSQSRAATLGSMLQGFFVL